MEKKKHLQGPEVDRHVLKDKHLSREIPGTPKHVGPPDPISFPYFQGFLWE